MNSALLRCLLLSKLAVEYAVPFTCKTGDRESFKLY